MLAARCGLSQLLEAFTQSLWRILRRARWLEWPRPQRGIGGASLAPDPIHRPQRLSTAMPASAGSQRASVHDSSDNQNDSSSRKPHWDTSPNTLPQFVAALKLWLPKADSRFRTLIQSNTVLSRQYLCFQSANHIDRYNNSLLGTGTPDAPVIVEVTDFVALPVGATSVVSTSSPGSPGTTTSTRDPLDPTSSYCVNPAVQVDRP